MLADLPRRKKRILTAAGLVLAATALAAVAVTVLTGESEDTYRPGEQIEGITAELSREIPGDRPRRTFTDVTDEAGIRFRHFPGRRSSQLPEDMGAGAAWGDYDRDGDPDLYVVNTLPLAGGDSAGAVARDAGSVLYENRGDGTFEDVTGRAGVIHRGQGMAASWADYDGDGWPDLLVTAYGGLTLYRNRGDGTFVERTSAAGLSGYRGFWAGVAWGDYDGDRDVDLYVTGYVRYDPGAARGANLQYEVEVPASLNPSSFQPERNLLFQNQGDGTFREISDSMGVTNRDGRSLEALWCDFDRDGWPDLYVANDVSDNVLYRNLGGRGFEDVSHRSRIADYRGAMGLAAGDWDADGDPDLFITHWIAQENALYRNFLREMLAADPPPRQTLRFADVADRLGLGQVALDYVGWATSFFDYDNDGLLDLFVANGHTFQSDEDPTRLVGQRDQLFWQRSPEDGFYDVSLVSGAYFRKERVGRGGAVADYDGDGDLDLFILSHGSQPALLRNDGEDRGNWLKVRLEGRPGNTAALGARLRLVAGGRVQHREVGAGAPYLSQDHRVQHFGLGEAAVADTLEVTWPSGEQTTLTRLRAGASLEIAEP